MEEHRVPREPHNQPGRVGRGAELDHDEGQGKNDAGKSHHSLGDRGEHGLGRSNSNTVRVGSQIDVLKMWQSECSRNGYSHDSSCNVQLLPGSDYYFV